MEESTPYVSFLTNRPMYLSGIQILKSHGVDTTQREGAENTIMTALNIASLSAVLSKNDIGYIMMYGPDARLRATDSGSFMDPVFHNREVEILKYSKAKADEYFKMEKL